MKIFDYAHKMGLLGCRVFPLPKRGKFPPPKGWKSLATNEEAQLKSWFHLQNRNYGVKTGEGLLVIDIDGSEGEQTFKGLLEELGALPDTFTVVTGNGRHLYFHYPKHINLRNSVSKDLGRKIDTRVNGGYVVGPGSTHPDGRVYEAVNWEEPIVDLPSKWLDQLSPHTKQAPKREISSNYQHSSILRKACYIIRSAKEGTRNDTLNHQAFEVAKYIGAGLIEDTEAESALTSAALEVGLELPEIQATLKSAILAGMKQSIPLNALPKRGRIYTATELMNRDFEPLRWAIPEFIPEGLTIFAGAPKLGKSWMVLDFCLSVALGRPTLSKFDVEQGEVLALMLEDNDRRIKSRIEALTAEDERLLDSFYLGSPWPVLTEGGLDDLRYWLDDHPRAKLIVIDTLAKVRPPQKNGMSYQNDYDVMGLLQGLAIERRVAIVAVHHTRKQIAADAFDQISGTQGIAGAADANFVLKRGRNGTDGVLHITGRDIEEKDYNVRFSPETLQWSILEGISSLPEGRQEILKLLEGYQGGLSPRQISEALGGNYNTIRKTLTRMANAGELQNPTRGLYLLSPHPSTYLSQSHMSQESLATMENVTPPGILSQVNPNEMNPLGDSDNVTPITGDLSNEPQP